MRFNADVSLDLRDVVVLFLVWAGIDILAVVVNHFL